MPTRPKKGGTPSQKSTGRAKGGGQKAVTGSGRSPQVASQAKKAVVNQEEQASPDDE